jgi:hypothetical protein
MTGDPQIDQSAFNSPHLIRVKAIYLVVNHGYLFEKGKT